MFHFSDLDILGFLPKNIQLMLNVLDYNAGFQLPFKNQNNIECTMHMPVVIDTNQVWEEIADKLSLNH